MVFLKGWQQIGATYGAGRKQSQAWHAMGAPILLLGREPVAEAGQLWAWLLANRAQVEAVPEAAGMTAAQAKKIIDGRPLDNLAGAILGKGAGIA